MEGQDPTTEAVDLDAIMAIEEKTGELIEAAIRAAADGIQATDLPAMAGELTGLITTTFTRAGEAGVELKSINRTERYALIRAAVDRAERIEAALDSAGAEA
jgi:hypothetical protein